ncbi:hypothetical protein [Flavobacterium mesophilum]|uniref:hypothetical protein n=1 Tax=Flavobacterium mesophilum TaxID=3143495 RepID=UPI0031D611AC
MNNKITIKKISWHELEVLNVELRMFASLLSAIDIKDDFLNTIISIDIARALYYKFRTKIENRKENYSLNLTISEAATLLQCCTYDNPVKTDFSKNVKIKLSSDLDQQLKSILI